MAIHGHFIEFYYIQIKKSLTNFKYTCTNEEINQYYLRIYEVIFISNGINYFQHFKNCEDMHGPLLNFGLLNMNSQTIECLLLISVPASSSVTACRERRHPDQTGPPSPPDSQ